MTKAKSELKAVQQLLSEKEKAHADNQKNLEEANKTATTARELRRELQFVKVYSFPQSCPSAFFYLKCALYYSGRDVDLPTFEIHFRI